MSGALVFEASFQRRRQGLGIAFVAPREAPGSEQRLGCAGRALVLAHRLQRALDQGEVRNQDHLALRLGVSPARLSTLLAVLGLAPDLQARLLEPRASRGPSLQQVLLIARQPLWADQRRSWGRLAEPAQPRAENGGEMPRSC